MRACWLMVAAFVEGPNRWRGCAGFHVEHIKVSVGAPGEADILQEHLVDGELRMDVPGAAAGDSPVLVGILKAPRLLVRLQLRNVLVLREVAVEVLLRRRLMGMRLLREGMLEVLALEFLLRF